MNEQDTSGDYAVIEGGGSAVADDGTIVSEDVTAIIDGDGNPVAVDDLVTIEAPDGSAAFDEVMLSNPGRERPAFRCAPMPRLLADPELLRPVFVNLLAKGMEAAYGISRCSLRL